MAVPRPLSVFLSFLFAIGLWVYGSVRLQTEGGIRGAYATLVCADTYSDREIRDRLDSQGLRDLVSESDQWVLLDCFGYIEKVPLVMYEERLLPFDPRNDGYAEKLKSVFIRDGKRFVYIPLEKNHPENLEIEIARALSGVSYSLEFARYPPGRDFLFPLISICLTVCAFFVIPALRRRLMLPCLIALSPLALGLAPGFALISLLAGFAALLAEPGQPPSGRHPHDLPKPFTARWLLAAALIACYGFFSFFSGLPVLFAFLVLASFCCLLLVSIRSGGLPIKFTVKKTYQRRHLFTPVEIISRKTVSSGFFPVMLPFAAMALVLAFTGFARPQPPPSPSVNISPLLAAPLPPGAVTEADFQEHYLFQSAFSFRALGEIYEVGEAPPAIAGYGLSPNGLLEPVAPGVDEELQIPDFPLSDLLRGLSSDLPRVADEVNPGNSADRLFALLPMIFILPAFIFYSIKKKRQGKYGARFAGFYR
jgi:hypothetical protein